MPKLEPPLLQEDKTTEETAMKIAKMETQTMLRRSRYRYFMTRVADSRRATTVER
jgi:hypothetical protein